MDCQFMRLTGYPEPDSALANSQMYRIRFTHNLKYCELYARCEKEWAHWIEQLGRIMIRTDFHDRFVVKKVLSEGAFAKVYLSLNSQDNKLYAVKAISKASLQRQCKCKCKCKAAMMSEINILRDLSHPNLKRLHDVDETKDSVYLVCEYLDGGTLSEYLQASEDLLSADRVISIMLDILCGLQSLEEKGVLHRDIKPDNIMLSQASATASGSLQLKICDFGLVCYSDVDQYLFTRCGTPGYVSPEVLKAVSKDAASRLTSLATPSALA